MKKALITGVTGQDGSYLSELLMEKGYEVHGVIRRSSVDYRERIAHLEGKENFHLHYGDVGDSMSMVNIIGSVRPEEIYNLAAQSHVQVSFDVPEFTADIDAVGVLRVLECLHAPVFCLIMNRNGAEKLLLPAKSPGQPAVLHKENRKSCILETYHPCVTGAMQKITQNACGGCFSMACRRILSLQQACSTVSGSFACLHFIMRE